MADLDDVLDTHQRVSELERSEEREHERPRIDVLKARRIVNNTILPPLREISEKLKARGHGASVDIRVPELVEIVMQPKGSPLEYSLKFDMLRTEGKITTVAWPSLHPAVGPFGPMGARAAVALKELSAGFVMDQTTEWIEEVLISDRSMFSGER